MAALDDKAILFVVESQSLPGNPAYVSWKITGRNPEKVQTEAHRLMHSVGANGFATFSFPRPIKTGPFEGWFYATGITCDGETKQCP